MFGCRAAVVTMMTNIMMIMKRSQIATVRSATTTLWISSIIADARRFQASRRFQTVRHAANSPGRIA